MALPTPRLTVIALALSAIHTASFAQNAPAPAKTPDAAVQKVEVTGSADKYDARKDDTATKIVITAEEIVKQGDTVLSDVLKRQPGVTVSGGNMGRGGGEIRMRGLGNGYTQILLNGEPAPPGFSVDSLAPDLVERIEIVRAATAEFSTQAIAGTINIVLKKQVKVGQRELKLNVSGAGNFIAPNANMQISDKEGRLSYSVSANVVAGRFDQESFQDDEAFDASGRKILQRHAVRNGRGNFLNLGVSPRLIWNLEGGDSLTSQTFLNINRVKPENSNDWRVALGGFPQYASDRTQVENHQDNFRTDLNWIHKMEGGAKLDAKVGLNANRRITDFAQQGYDSSGRLILDSTTPGTAREGGLTTTGKYSMPFAEDHTLATGWDLGASRRNETRNQHDKPIPGFVPVVLDQSYHADLSRAAVFVQDEWNVTPKWSVYVGARWEGIETKTEGNDFAQVTNRSSVFSPLFQTLWKLPDSKNDQVRFALTKTYKAPGLDRLIPRRFTQANNSPTTPDQQGNPNLKPELALGMDAAYEHYFGPSGAMMSASVYARRLDDFIHRDVVLQNGRWVALPVNDGRAMTRGIELEAKFPLQLFFPEAPNMDLRFNLARNWSSVDDVPGPNNRLADQIPVTANFGLDYKYDAKWSGGGTFTFKTGGPIRISETVSTYATVKRELDLYALWKIDPKMQLRVSALNVLGQSFYNVDEYRDLAGLSRTTQEFPVTPLLRAQLELKF